jgi:hypothetical protein
MRRRDRFPRYAPEPLESRLTPTAVAFPTSPPPADVITPPAPAPEPGDPPITDPNSPIGPALPA